MQASEAPSSTVQKGFSLFELIIAVLLLAVISTIIYSIMNVSIGFTEKADKHIQQLEQEQGLLNLLRRQIKNGWYDERTHKVNMIADEMTLRISTRSPFLYAEAGVVLAVYRYDPVNKKLYYMEKRDFYNVDYDENYSPEFDEMLLLIEKCPHLSFSYGENERSLTVYYGDKVYAFTPWCN